VDTSRHLLTRGNQSRRLVRHRGVKAEAAVQDKQRGKMLADSEEWDA
jgi:hypothetical protein